MGCGCSNYSGDRYKNAAGPPSVGHMDWRTARGPGQQGPGPTIDFRNAKGTPPSGWIFRTGKPGVKGSMVADGTKPAPPNMIVTGRRRTSSGPIIIGMPVEWRTGLSEGSGAPWEPAPLTTYRGKRGGPHYPGFPTQWKGFEG